MGGAVWKLFTLKIPKLLKMEKSRLNSLLRRQNVKMRKLIHKTRFSICVLSLVAIVSFRFQHIVSWDWVFFLWLPLPQPDLVT